MAGVPVARILFPLRRSHRRPDARCDCHPRADGHRAARRLRAADRLLRLHGGLGRLRAARRQPFSVTGRGLHDHADLRRRTRGAGCDRLAGISGPCDRAGADGRRDDARRRRLPARRHRQSVVGACHGRLPRRHLRAHHRVAIAGRARIAVTKRPDARSHRRARNRARPDQSRDLLHRLRRAGGGLHLGEDQSQNSRRADRAGGRDARGDRARAREQGRQRRRHGAGHAAATDLA